MKPFLISAAVALLLPLSVHCSECPTIPGDFVTRLRSGDREAESLLWRAFDACPQSLSKLGKNSTERSLLKSKYTAVLNYQEKVIVAESAYKNVDLTWQRYLAANDLLGVHSTPPPGLKEIVEKARRESSRREAQCTAIDNRTPSLSSVRNQGPTGWCYAFAAADLLSHKLQTQVSALDVAFNYNAMDAGRGFNRSLLAFDKVRGRFDAPVFETSVEGGRIGAAIQMTQKKGACLEKDLPSNHQVVSDIKQSLDDLHRLKERVKAEPDLCSYSEYKKSFARFPALAMAEVIQTATESSHAELMMNLAAKSCKERISLRGIEAVHLEVAETQGGFDQVANAIDQQLQEKSIVGVSYDVGMIMPGQEGGHGSTLVGRRFNKDTGECEYMMRNTWGSATFKNSSVENKDGYYWIPKTALKKYLQGVTYLK